MLFQIFKMFDKVVCISIIVLVIAYINFNHGSFKERISNQEDNLVLTHIIFRHGDRTPDSVELYPNDPYINETYHPYGRGQLTKEGKRREYNIGTSLRQRYQSFLGDYYPDIVDAVTTDYQRTKVSLQLVLAGLFPPSKEEMWDDNILWQPIPYNYAPKNQDKILLSTLCKYYLELYNNATDSTEIRQEYQKYNDVFKYISKNTGLNVTRFLDVYNLYFGLSTEDNIGLVLPKWTEVVWPTTVTKLATKEYLVNMATSEMKQIATGYLIEKIIEDTKTKIFGSNKQGTKMYLYSAHENNIAQLLIALGVFEPHVPNYGSYIVTEVHYIDNTFGFKFYYENYEDNNGPRLLKMPTCQEFCPIKEFISIMEDFIPKEDKC